AAFTITVSNTNDAPVITGTPATTAAEDTAYSFTPIVSDVDAGDTQTFSISNKPTWATFSTSTGGLTGTPVQADIGTTSGIIISVADAANATVSLAAFTITVSNTN
ncbi:putative Ig domain-containing protein, partial [Colwellia sp. MB02u-9]|uniref:putative Ig domain-containing protein n=1 Tax=Colwellia sp. MB02u-9 TaxID=2759823 RepID=UPI0015F459A4